MSHLYYAASSHPRTTPQLASACFLVGPLPHDLGLKPLVHPIPQNTVQAGAQWGHLLEKMLSTLDVVQWHMSLYLLFSPIKVSTGFFTPKPIASLPFPWEYPQSFDWNTLPLLSLFFHLFFIFKIQFMSPPDLACPHLIPSSQDMSLCFCGTWT